MRFRDIIRRLLLAVFVVLLFALAAGSIGCGVESSSELTDTTEQGLTAYPPSGIGPYSCVAPYDPLHQPASAHGWCEFHPATTVTSNTSLWWRLSSCGTSELNARATVQVTLEDGRCAQLWGALNSTGTRFGPDVIGAYGMRSDTVDSGHLGTRIISYRIPADTYAEFCPGDNTSGACVPEGGQTPIAWGTESTAVYGYTYSTTIKSVFVRTW